MIYTRISGLAVIIHVKNTLKLCNDHFQKYAQLQYIIIIVLLE